MTEDVKQAPNRAAWEHLLSGLTLGQLIRYAYAGALAVGLAATVKPSGTHEVLEALGTWISVGLAILAGIAIHIFYREFLGELIFYPIRHHLHTAGGMVWRRIARAIRRHAGEPGSFTMFLGTLGVDYGYRRWAYRNLRVGSFFPSNEKQQLDFLHSQLHLIYITAVEVGLAGGLLYLSATSSSTDLIEARDLLRAALGLLLIANLVDIYQDRFETRVLRARQEEVKKALVSMGLIRSST